MSLKPLGTLLHYLAHEDPSLPQGGLGLLPYPIQGGLSSSLEPLGTLLPCPAKGDWSSSQGDQGLLPYPIQVDLSMSMKPLGALLPGLVYLCFRWVEVLHMINDNPHSH